MRIGLYGGSFDPVHMGHLQIAEIACDQLRLDRIVFLPAAQSPLKQEIVHEDPKLRIEMVRLAIGGNPRFFVDDREISRGGISYTVDTLQEITLQPVDKSDVTNQGQKNEWFLIIGADSLADFPRWKSPELILKLATLAVVARGGQPALDWSVLNNFLDPNALARIKGNEIRMPQIEISSRDIRARVASGKSIRYLVHPAVGAFIEAKNLYSPAIKNTPNLLP